jgi:hypothetical protein
MLPAGRGGASRAATAQVSPGPALQVGSTGRTPAVPARTAAPPGASRSSASSPQFRGVVGKEYVKDQAAQRGLIFLGEEVSVDVAGGKPVVFDLLFIEMTPDAAILWVYDAKNGPHARLTPNQRVSYPLINRGALITLHGPRAVETGLADTPMRTKVREFRVDVPTR